MTLRHIVCMFVCFMLHNNQVPLIIIHTLKQHDKVMRGEERSHCVFHSTLLPVTCPCPRVTVMTPSRTSSLMNASCLRIHHVVYVLITGRVKFKSGRNSNLLFSSPLLRTTLRSATWRNLTSWLMTFPACNPWHLESASNQNIKWQVTAQESLWIFLIQDPDFLKPLSFHFPLSPLFPRPMVNVMFFLAKLYTFCCPLLHNNRHHVILVSS
jgi:hypothetical protein